MTMGQYHCKNESGRRKQMRTRAANVNIPRFSRRRFGSGLITVVICLLQGTASWAVADDQAVKTATGLRAPMDVMPMSLRLVPAQAILRNAGASQRFLVVGTMSDGAERDVT